MNGVKKFQTILNSAPKTKDNNESDTVVIITDIFKRRNLDIMAL